MNFVLGYLTKPGNEPQTRNSCGYVPDKETLSDPFDGRIDGSSSSSHDPQFYVWSEKVKPSMDWLIKRLIKVGARVSYPARRWYVHVASAFPLSYHYRAVLAWDS